MGRQTIILLFLLISNYLTVSCGNSPYRENEIHQLKEEFILRLQDNIAPISPIISFDFISEDQIVVITEKNQVILYDNNGKQTKVLDILGAGQYEMINPTIVRKYQDYFFIWCADLLKLVQFDKDGNPVEEYLGFDHAVRDFSVSRDEIITYIPNITDQPYIQVYQKIPFKKTKEFGFVENEQVLLNFNACSGALDMWNNTLLYAPSNALKIHQLDLDRMVDDKVIIFENEKFKVEKLKEDALNLMNQDRIKALEFGLKNSILKGVHVLDDFVVLIAEVGQFDLNNFQPISIDREELILILDQNFNLLKTSSLPYEFNKPCNLIRSQKNNLYRIKFEEGVDEMEYVLLKVLI